MMVSLPRFFHSVFNQIFLHSFLGAVADAVHPAHPLHLVFRFYLLSNAFALGHLSQEPIEHFFGS